MLCTEIGNIYIARRMHISHTYTDALYPTRHQTLFPEFLRLEVMVTSKYSKGVVIQLSPFKFELTGVTILIFCFYFRCR